LIEGVYGKEAIQGQERFVESFNERHFAVVFDFLRWLVAVTRSQEFRGRHDVISTPRHEKSALLIAGETHKSDGDATFTMSSGFGLRGSIGRCYPFYAEYKECLVSVWVPT
jgi:hypothetical protein